MYEVKTRPSDTDVAQFIERIQPEAKRADALRLLQLYQAATGWPPVLWGGKMIGFGHYRYQYKSGHRGEAFVTGFAAPARRLTLYLYLDEPVLQGYLKRLGKARAGKSCVYINKLADIDTEVLTEMIHAAVDFVCGHFEVLP